MMRPASLRHAPSRESKLARSQRELSRQVAIAFRGIPVVGFRIFQDGIDTTRDGSFLPKVAHLPEGRG